MGNKLCASIQVSLYALLEICCTPLWWFMHVLKIAIRHVQCHIISTIFRSSVFQCLHYSLPLCLLQTGIGQIWIALLQCSLHDHSSYDCCIFNWWSSKGKLIISSIDSYSILKLWTNMAFLLWFLQAYDFEDWRNPLFLFQFLLSCFMGFILMYSIIICTHYNSALTTTIVGVLKVSLPLICNACFLILQHWELFLCFQNLLVTYLGMVIGGDYVFSWVNFSGLNIRFVCFLLFSLFSVLLFGYSLFCIFPSVIGSLFYTYITFVQKAPPKEIATSISVEVKTRTGPAGV